MELNKYDLIEYLVSHFDYIACRYCPIKKECDERKELFLICMNDEKIRETLIKKYNL